MADILLSPALYWALFGGALCFTVLGLRTQRLCWAISAALCSAVGCLLGLAAERSLEQLLTAVLIPTVIVLLSRTDQKGGSAA